MIHEVEDIERELSRVVGRPAVQDVPPVLSAFDVRTGIPVAEFEGRVRAVLGAALRVALSRSFDGGDIPVDLVPDWFVAASTGRGEAWDVQGWLWQFEPGDESRGWAWWDLRESGERTARVWVDSWGEYFFGCDDFRWLARAAGAEEVSGPVLVRAGDWAAGVPF
ncbi:hypothetical protein AB0I54_09720 [Streptomyces sp. NPDC050625]|uniref:hypothetical protein n=1 Tax=Streptomyces sp. NPDC050625 TaxID=3154629 RepID=UPI0034319863